MEKLRFITLKIDANFERKLTCSFINGMRNLVNFIRALKNFNICALRDFFV